ncbi:FAD binding domain protein [Aspergillus pseudoustus]|uniref:FAD binding domain protein n=1 Tax=Aspergillus pseudoustus TaxID=1810923 RepID=A0ABR4JXI1_9EURO
MQSPLHVIITGAGLSGLATAVSLAQSGHNVTILEQAQELAEVGAGLQVTPNASRLFQHWGLPQSIWSSAVEPKTLTVHRYTGDVLAHDATFDKRIRARYGAPFVDVHRVDLQQALFTRAKELGVQVHLSERVKNVQDDSGSATATVLTESGKRYTGDLVVAADGLWSRCRECLIGRKDDPLPTGDLAYRIVLNDEQITDPKLRDWVRNPQVHFWIGPGAHVVAYSMRGGDMINIVLLVPDNLPPGVSREEGSVEEMKGLFQGWDPVLTQFLSYVDKVDKWKLMHHAEMSTWINPSSTLVFVGDACHPMLPYLAQGANSSLEDGAVLGGLLGHMKSKSQLPAILRLYEALRKERGEAIVRETFKQRHDFHLPDGPEQEKRDEIFRAQLPNNGEIVGAFPSRWTCPEVQPWLYGYDAVQEVEEAVARNPGLFVTSNL